MYKYIVQNSVTSKTTHNLSHIDTTNTIQPIANTIMSTKLTDDTLQLFIVKSPVSTMSIHIAFKLHDFNVRNIFTIQLLTYETMSEYIDSTNAMECSTVKRRASKFLTYKDVFACKFSHRWTCLYATCYIISYVKLDRHVSIQMCRLRDVFMCVFTH